MITIVDGDLMEAKEEVIAHQVNCMGVMGSGVAVQIKEKFPNAFLEYLKHVHVISDLQGRKSLLGDCQIVKCENKEIANLFGQLNYGRDGKQYTNISNLKTAFASLRSHLDQKGLKSLAMPYKIASDRGGADWNQVREIIEEVFDGVSVTLYRFDGGKQ